MIDSSVQVAIIGGFFTLGGYFIGAVQKTIERYLGQKHFQSNALGILKGLSKDMDALEKSITDLNRGMQSQKSIMKELLSYSRQHADAAVRMSEIVEDFIHKTDTKNEDEQEDEE